MNMDLSFEVNGGGTAIDVEARALLGQVLRDDFRLASVRLDCETSSCGACTVLLDGDPVKSCAVLAVMAQDRAVTTVEGLATDPVAASVLAHVGGADVLPCGECTAAVVVVATALLREVPRPSAEQVSRALSGSMCRCTGYRPIIDSVLRAAEAKAPRAVAEQRGA
jgi:carbon-monoxide dehydrogenase small subunit